MKEMFCGSCPLNDGVVYTSDPPMYRCTVDGKYHFGNERCTYKDCDFMPVIRCKNCKYFLPFGIHDGLCDISGLLEDNNFFCKDGVKREDDR